MSYWLKFQASAAAFARISITLEEHRSLAVRWNGMFEDASGWLAALNFIAGYIFGVSDQEVLEVANRATQHLYFTNPIKKLEQRSSGLFSTHPPIVERINRLRQLTGEQPLTQRDMTALTGLD